jgi:peroxiredoxin-like protein
MQKLPHTYTVSVTGKPEEALHAQAAHLPALEVAPPAQFNGPGDKWSPEELLMAAMANCLVLSFRAIASASKLAWQSIEVSSEGELNNENGKIKFTAIRSKATLTIDASYSQEKAEKLLKKAEQTCFVSNSLNCDSDLVCEIFVAHG